MFRKHGGIGTTASRKNGGHISQMNRKYDPAYYEARGCSINSYDDISVTSKFAEVVGILIGDGSISRGDQVKMYLNARIDREYVQVVCHLCQEVFGRRPRWRERERNTIELSLNGFKLIEKLKYYGLSEGDKIKNGIRIPVWIKSDNILLRSCLRGLLDTDGGVFIHHKRKKSETYVGVCFTSASPALIKDVVDAMHQNNIQAKKTAKDRVFIYREAEVRKYLESIGTRNPKNTRRFYEVLNRKKKV